MANFYSNPVPCTAAPVYVGDTVRVPSSRGFEGGCYDLEVRGVDANRVQVQMPSGRLEWIARFACRLVKSQDQATLQTPVGSQVKDKVSGPMFRVVAAIGNQLKLATEGTGLISLVDPSTLWVTEVYQATRPVVNQVRLPPEGSRAMKELVASASPLGNKTDADASAHHAANKERRRKSDLGGHIPTSSGGGGKDKENKKGKGKKKK